MYEAKQMALKDIDMLQDGDVYEKMEALQEVIDPLSVELANITGEAYVKSMSLEALEFYS